MCLIFIIEDNPDHALLIIRSIKDEKTTIQHFSDGMSAVKACEGLRNGGDRPHLILLDMKLPGMDGFDVLKAVKKMEHLMHVPIVMFTTSARREEIEKAYELGACGYVVKPDDFDEFIEKLQQVKTYWLKTVEKPSAVSAEGAKGK